MPELMFEHIEWLRLYSFYLRLPSFCRSILAEPTFPSLPIFQMRSPPHLLYGKMVYFYGPDLTLRETRPPRSPPPCRSGYAHYFYSLHPFPQRRPVASYRPPRLIYVRKRGGFHARFLMIVSLFIDGPPPSPYILLSSVLLF